MDYIKHRQRQWQKKWQREADLEAKKEAERVAIIEEEARKQEEIVARKKLLLEQQEAERLRQKHIQVKEKLAEDSSGNGNHGTFAAISGDTTAYPTWDASPF